ncbi:MAG: TatD family hydrolase [Actinomycetota bacterium]
MDSHCHLDTLGEEVPDVLARAAEAGVEAMVTVGCDLESSASSVALASRHAQVWATVGIHPHEADGYGGKTLGKLLALTEGDKVVAIGEIGLDYYRDLAPRAAQRRAFRGQLAAAERLGLPVVIHVRDAHDDLFAILDEVGPPARLVFHCFSGGPEEAAAALERGGCISFAGNVSFRKAQSLREAARLVPLDRLLVETDSPYLTPVPHRGKRNEPAHVRFVGAALAEACGRSMEEISRATAASARAVFRLPGAEVG